MSLTRQLVLTVSPLRVSVVVGGVSTAP